MLKDKIDKDLFSSMRAKDESTTSVLRLLKSAIKNEEIKLQKELDDAGVIQITQKQIKLHLDSIAMFESGGRDELAKKEAMEIKILEKYVPEQMPEDKIHELCRKSIAETRALDISDMGKVMAKIMPEVRGKADGALVSKIVKEELLKQ